MKTKTQTPSKFKLTFNFSLSSFHFLLFTFTFSLLTFNSYAQPEIVAQIGHTDAVNSVAYSPDGKMAISGSSDGTLKLWDVESGKLIRTFIGHSATVNSVIFSADGKYVFSGSDDGYLKQWDIKNGNERKSIAVGELKKILLSPDNKHIISIVATRFRRWISIVNIDNEKVAHIFQGLVESCGENDGRHRRISSIVITNNGNRLISSCYCEFSSFNTCNRMAKEKAESAFISYWDFFYDGGILKVKLVKNLKIHANWVNSLAINKDGSLIASGSNDRTIKLWNIQNENVIRTFSGHNSRVQYVDICPNNKYILSYSSGKALKLWDVATGKEEWSHVFETDEITSIAFSPDGKTALLGSKKNHAKLWNVYSGKELRRFEGSAVEVLTQTYSPDGKFALLALSDGNLIYWDMYKGSEISRIKTTHTGNITAVSFLPEGEAPFPNMKTVATASMDQKIKIWNLSSGKEMRSVNCLDVIKECNASDILTPFSRIHKNLQARYSTIFFLPDKTKAYVKHPMERHVHVYDILKNEFDNKIRTTNYLLAFGFTTNGRYFIGSYTLANGRIGLWDIKEKKKRRIKNFGIAGRGKPPVLSSANSNYLLMATDDLYGDNIMLMDITGKRKIREKSIKKFDINHLGLKITALSFSSCNKYFYSASSDNLLRYWNIESGEVVKSFPIVYPTINNLQVLEDEKKVLAVSDIGVTIYDVEKEKPVYTAMFLTNGKNFLWSGDGFFEGDIAAARKNFHIVDGTNVFFIDQFFEKLYRPGIVEYLMGGGQIETEEIAILSNINLPTLVKITSPQNNTNITTSQATITLQITDQGGGIDEIRLYHNGKLIDGTQRGFKPVARDGATETKTFTVALVNGENRIRATAFNTQRTESIPHEIVVHYKAPEIVKPNLYILAIGINKYENSRYDLNFAVKDAQVFTTTLENVGKGIFDKVHKTVITDAACTKKNIMAEIDKIKRTIKAEDVFVFYYAGHGVMSMGSAQERPDFFLVLHDITRMYEADNILKEKGISSQEIMQFSKEIRAQKQLFVMDACQSGGAVQTLAMRGAGEEKAIAQLARSTGTYFIASSGTEQDATEVASLGHGIFTYSVIKSLEGECKSNDKNITVNLLKSCIEQMVPELSKKHKGTTQYPTGYGFGQDFPIGVVK